MREYTAGIAGLFQGNSHTESNKIMQNLFIYGRGIEPSLHWVYMHFLTLYGRPAGYRIHFQGSLDHTEPRRSACAGSIGWGGGNQNNMPSRRWYTTGTEGIKGVTGVGPDQLAVNRQTSCSKTTSRVRTLRSVITTTLFLFQNELWGLG